MSGLFRNRWFLALAAAVIVAISITMIISSVTRPPAEKEKVDAVAIWKARTGVDLAALRSAPVRTDSEDARALDQLLEPLDLKLGGRSRDRKPSSGKNLDDDALSELRERLRAEMRVDTPEPQPLSPTVVSLLDKNASTLDAVADYVEKHRDIQWHTDFGPRHRSSALYASEHLILHRLLIGRAFLALERSDAETAERMLATSAQLNQVLVERDELESQFLAAGVERLQLALMRRAGSTLGVELAEPSHRMQERFLAGMSAEAALILTNAERSGVINQGGDPDDVVIRTLAAPRLAAAARETVAQRAKEVAEIRSSQDGCAELQKKRPAPPGMFSGNFYAFNPTEAWRRFQVGAIDRAITTAVLTGRVISPCPSVTITVRDDEKTRTVETKGLPERSENVLTLPPLVTTRLKR